MPSPFVLSSVTLARPDGTPLLPDISVRFGPGLTALAGPNGVGKSTLLRLLAGEVVPALGQVQRPARLGFLRQVEPACGRAVRDLYPPAIPEGLVMASLARAGLVLAVDRPLSCLSGGQQTRVRLAALLAADPEALLLDEPTNHLDAGARRGVLALLRQVSGPVVVASHDPELLRLCPRIAELTPRGLIMHGDGYDAFLEARARDAAARARALDLAERGQADAQRAAQAAAERKARRDAGGRRERASGSQGKMLMDFRKERAEGSARGLSRLADRRAEAAQSGLSAARAAVDHRTPLSALMPRLSIPSTRLLLRARDVTGGADPARPAVGPLALDICGPERIAVTGPNGSGKSTLLRLLAGDLRPVTGQVDRFARVARLDQQVTPAGADLVEAFRLVHPALSLNDAHAALARFGFRGAAARVRPDRLSGGEALRAALAIQFGGPMPPEILLLDEPSNHLDAAARQMLIEALVACDAALVIASHDRAFLEAVGIQREIEL